ncbi:MAG: RDD family protein [Nesterenkonia sp.]|uniref:RDD family protein n=1 Tax=Nesterenkonia marinintestina TaxID=2979865 RepID=UPI0021C10A5F|nr:RDD family protein [Nesterenkonia sp. GX14115]MDO5492539.1 RDD family protein [Nesterenkonia sp.]
MSTVVTGEAVRLELPTATVLSRGVSCLIDWAVNFTILVVMMFLLGMLSGTVQIAGDPAMEAAVILSTFVTAFVIVPVAVETLSRGRSLGRLIMGVRIVRDDGGTIRLRHALIRGLLAPFEILMTFGSVAFICGVLSPRGKRLGDMVAGTYGILTRQPSVPPMMLPVPQHMTSWTHMVDVGRVPDPLAMRISRLLRTAERAGRGGNRSVLERTADDLAAELRPYVSPPPPPSSSFDFLVAVMAERRNREYRRMRRNQQRGDELGRRLHRLPYS